MKNLITIILLFVAANVTAQDLTLLHINAKWNQSNDYNLDRIRNVKVTMAKLEDQKPELKAQIKAVPTIILIGKDLVSGFVAILLFSLSLLVLNIFIKIILWFINIVN